MPPSYTKVLIKLFLQLIIASNCMSQNLVSNPSFEYNTGCPGNKGNIELVDDWWSPFGQAYYFHVCSNYKTEYRWIVPKGQKLYNEIPIEAYQGDAYVGIAMSSILSPDNQDYLMTKLKEPLKQGQCYRVNMWVRLGDVWKFIDYIGVYFSKDKYRVSKDQIIMSYIPYKNEYKTERLDKRVSLIFKKDTLQLRAQELLNSRDGWVKIEGEYFAKGGEQYISIGNFSITWKGLYSNNLTPKEEVTIVDGLAYIQGDFDYSYYDRTFYYIDDVSVSEMPLEASKTYHQFSSNMIEGQTLELENIYFDTGQAVLKQESLPTLELLLIYMRQNAELKLCIAGHTDNAGDDDYNRHLSAQRAAAIITYLKINGIASQRLKAIGYGSTRPVADNSSAKGREQNRRVEFTLSKQ